MNGNETKEGTYESMTIEEVIDLYRDAIPKIFEKSFWDRIYPAGFISLLILDISLVFLNLILKMFISNEAKGIFQNLYTVRMYNFVCELSMSEVKAFVAESFNELSIARMKRKLLDFFRELPIPRMIAYLWLCLTNYIAIFMIFAIWINGYGYDPLYKLFYNLPYPSAGKIFNTISPLLNHFSNIFLRRVKIHNIVMNFSNKYK